uniref:Uncharacterized protein n=1 Tax=Daucus carota subsp. sativus TaxID=79200 RepID=A0A165X6I7_DAUCS
MDPQGIKRRLASNIEKLIKLFDVLIDDRLELKRRGNPDENTGTADLLDGLLKLLESHEIDKSVIQHMFVNGTVLREFMTTE